MEETTEGLICGNSWNIEFNVSCDNEFGGYVPCRHAYDKQLQGSSREGTWYTWRVPRMLNITPDDPYQCAQICLDCLLEKLGQITVSQWIHITKALPEPGTDVLVCDPDGDVTLAEFWYNGECYGWSDLTSDGVVGWELDQIEWWMPKPPPRKPI